MREASRSAHAFVALIGVPLFRLFRPRHMNETRLGWSFRPDDIPEQYPRTCCIVPGEGMKGPRRSRRVQDGDYAAAETHLLSLEGDWLVADALIAEDP